MAIRLTAGSRGFTLIEVLVVMGVIAILVALLMPVIGTVRESAKKSQAKSEAQRIEAAIHAYFSDYNKLPLTTQGSADVLAETTASMTVIKAMIAQDPALNPRAVPYIAAQGQNLDGTYLDPWGSQYVLWFDANYDGRIDFKLGAITTNVPGSALVVSYGRKVGTPSFIYSHGFEQ